MLVRFAGPRLAAATDSLIPVDAPPRRPRARRQPLLADAAAARRASPTRARSPGMTVPDDVLVNRQVLAEPDGTLADRTWAALADGTPLVTAAPTGKGWLILFHVTADTSWSNLPLSGTFVDMLRRDHRLLDQRRRRQRADGGRRQPVAPYRLLDGYGHFTAPRRRGASRSPATSPTIVPEPSIRPASTAPRTASARSTCSTTNADARRRSTSPRRRRAASRAYPTAAPTDLRPGCSRSPLALLAPRRARRALAERRPALAPPAPRPRGDRAARRALLARAAAADGAPRRRGAATSSPSTAVDKTQLAYVDHRQRRDRRDQPRRARRPLAGPRRSHRARARRPDRRRSADATSWPSSRSSTGRSIPTRRCRRRRPWHASTPTCATAARCSSTRATSSSARPASTRSPARRRSSGCAQMLASLDIPPLEPVPADHVLTKAFYLLNEFPGR